MVRTRNGGVTARYRGFQVFDALFDAVLEFHPVACQFSCPGLGLPESVKVFNPLLQGGDGGSLMVCRAAGILRWAREVAGRWRSSSYSGRGNGRGYGGNGGRGGNGRWRRGDRFREFCLVRGKKGACQVSVVVSANRERCAV